MDDLQQKSELALALFSDQDFRRQAILITQGYIDEFTPEFEDVMFYCTPRDGKLTAYASKIFNEVISLAIIKQSSLEDLKSFYGEASGSLLHSYLELTKNVMLTMITPIKKYQRVMNEAN